MFRGVRGPRLKSWQSLTGEEPDVPRLKSTSSDKGRVATNHATQVRDPLVCLDVLATQLRSRGWTAYLATPPGRLASLVVQDPHDRAQCSDIIAAPAGSAGDLWYWFSWGERIASAATPAAAADAIIGARSNGPDHQIRARAVSRHQGPADDR
jgi:hypothetical protein